MPGDPKGMPPTCFALCRVGLDHGRRCKSVDPAKQNRWFDVESRGWGVSCKRPSPPETPAAHQRVSLFAGVSSPPRGGPMNGIEIAFYLGIVVGAISIAAAAWVLLRWR